MSKTKRGEPLAWLARNIRDGMPDCVEWPFAKTAKGYGSVRYKGRTWHVHTLVCTTMHGSPPDGMTDAAHTCGNRLCVNPDHIRWSSPGDNQRDKIKHGTILRGESHKSAKLTEADVRAIRESAERGSKLAVMYGVAHQSIVAIRARRNWAWLS